MTSCNDVDSWMMKFIQLDINLCPAFILNTHKVFPIIKSLETLIRKENIPNRGS